MSRFEFDDTQTSGILWSTNIAIRDLCSDLKIETSCSDDEIAELLRAIANSIDIDSL